MRTMKRISLIVVTLLIASAAQAETYRLIHAIGNAEKEVARDLSKPECENRKRELKATAEAIGTYNAKSGAGSITCLPESLFKS